LAGHLANDGQNKIAPENVFCYYFLFFKTTKKTSFFFGCLFFFMLFFYKILLSLQSLPALFSHAVQDMRHIL